MTLEEGVCVCVCTRVCPCAYWGHREVGDIAFPSENFVPDTETSFHLLRFCGFYFW